VTDDLDRTTDPVDPLSCDEAVELISAALDGETVAADRRRLDLHLARCGDCDALADRLLGLDRRIRVRRADAVPDLVPVVTSRVRPAQLGRGGWIRPSLVWVAIVLFAQSLPALVLGRTDGADTHLARHLGAFGVALAIGFAYAAWRPHRAFGMVPFAAALVVTMSASTGFDVLDGGRSALSELAHLAELVGLVLLWLLAGSPGWHGRPRWARRHHPA
jgi:predicted anti-sigma-YlaC factor YlaD